MTNYPSEQDQPKRAWSVLPSRAIGDKRLKERELRVLGALCIYTNRAGVCWPSMDALARVSDYKERRSIYDAMKVLKKLGYVRQLDPKDYQETSSGWKSNRYQVLWRGDESIPSQEDIHIGKPIGVREDDEDAPAKEIGGLGDAEQLDSALALSLAHAFCRGLAEATGQVRLPENEVNVARRLVGKITPPELVVLTRTTCQDWLRRRAGLPCLSDVTGHLL